MKQLQRKTCLLDEVLVKKAKKLLGAKSDSEAIRKALGLVILQEEAARAWSANAGRGAGRKSKQGGL